MLIHPQIVHQNGIVTVTLVASFTGAGTDATDQQRITAYGDPEVNMGGTFTDPADSTFSFSFPAAQLFAGVTTQMASYSAQFSATNPQAAPGIYPATSTTNPLFVVVSDYIRAATLWATLMDARILTLMTALRAKTPAQLSSLSDANI